MVVPESSKDENINENAIYPIVGCLFVVFGIFDDLAAVEGIRHHSENEGNSRGKEETQTNRVGNQNYLVSKIYRTSNVICAGIRNTRSTLVFD